MTWNEARIFCQRDGADLARLPTRRNTSEVNKIISELGIDVEYWIGLFDDASGRQYRWIDGAMQTLDNWATGEPDGHTCAVISEFSEYRKWGGADCNNTKAFVCEKRDKSKGFVRAILRYFYILNRVCNVWYCEINEHEGEYSKSS